MTTFSSPFTNSRPSVFDASGLFLHASSVVMEDVALLFLGHSTAGKSTLARLLGRRFPVLADDSVYASRDEEGRWRVVDGGFRSTHGDVSGWQEAVRRRSAEGPFFRLAGCLRIHKAEAEWIEPLAPLDLARCLMDAAMEIDIQRKTGRFPRAGEVAGYDPAPVRRMRRHWFHEVSEMARACPGWNLGFAKDSRESALSGILLPLARGKGPGASD